MGASISNISTYSMCDIASYTFDLEPTKSIPKNGNILVIFPDEVTGLVTQCTAQVNGKK